MMNIFKLTWGYHDCETAYYLIAPDGTTRESFEELCDDLMDEAAREAISSKGRQWEDVAGGDDMPIGWGSVVFNLAHVVLPKRGFSVVEMPAVNYPGTDIMRFKDDDDEKGLLSQESFEEIYAHNEKIYEWWKETTS